MEKMESKESFPTFARHGYGYLHDSIHEIGCIWALYAPLPRSSIHLLFAYARRNLFISIT
jgi:hypothetical protein